MLQTYGQHDTGQVGGCQKTIHGMLKSSGRPPRPSAKRNMNNKKKMHPRLRNIKTVSVCVEDCPTYIEDRASIFEQERVEERT